MTVKEIIESINFNLSCGSDEIPTTQEDLILIKKAIEKQIPKKPKNYLVNMKHIDFLCPNCKKKIISKVDGEWVAGKKQQHCDNCGQALDWSDENDL